MTHASPGHYVCATFLLWILLCSALDVALRLRCGPDLIELLSQVP